MEGFPPGEDGFFVCSQCGTKYTLEEVKKMLGTGIRDKSKEIENWLVIARREGNDGNAANAAKYYGMVLEQEPQNWEAYFFQRFHQVNKCKVSQIPDSIDMLKRSIVTTADLIDKSSMSTDEKWKAFAKVCNSSMKYAEAIGQTEVRHRVNMANKSGNIFGSKGKNGKPEWIVTAEGIYTTIENILGSVKFTWMNGGDYLKFLSETWVRNYKFVDQYGYFCSKKDKQALAKRAIKYIDPKSTSYDYIKKASEEKGLFGF